MEVGHGEGESYVGMRLTRASSEKAPRDHWFGSGAVI